MAPRRLFSKVDIFSVMEGQKKGLRQAFAHVPDADIEDPAALGRLRRDWGINVPRLRESEKYATERRTKVDVSREPDRMILTGRDRFMSMPQR